MCFVQVNQQRLIAVFSLERQRSETGRQMEACYGSLTPSSHKKIKGTGARKQWQHRWQIAARSSEVKPTQTCHSQSLRVGSQSTAWLTSPDQWWPIVIKVNTPLAIQRQQRVSRSRVTTNTNVSWCGIQRDLSLTAVTIPSAVSVTVSCQRSLKSGNVGNFHKVSAHNISDLGDSTNVIGPPPPPPTKKKQTNKNKKQNKANKQTKQTKQNKETWNKSTLPFRGFGFEENVLYVKENSHKVSAHNVSDLGDSMNFIDRKIDVKQINVSLLWL